VGGRNSSEAYVPRKPFNHLRNWSEPLSYRVFNFILRASKLASSLCFSTEEKTKQEIEEDSITPIHSASNWIFSHFMPTRQQQRSEKLSVVFVNMEKFTYAPTMAIGECACATTHNERTQRQRQNVEMMKQKQNDKQIARFSSRSVKFIRYS
jgi:hypothetical protein